MRGLRNRSHRPHRSPQQLGVRWLKRVRRLRRRHRRLGEPKTGGGLGPGVSPGAGTSARTINYWLRQLPLTGRRSRRSRLGPPLRRGVLTLSRPEQPSVDGGFQRMVSDPGWAASGAADRARFVQPVFVGGLRVLREQSWGPVLAAGFYAAVRRIGVSEHYPGGQMAIPFGSSGPVFRRLSAWWTERWGLGSNSLPRASGTERRARTENRIGCSRRRRRVRLPEFAGPAAPHRSMGQDVQRSSSPRSPGPEPARSGVWPAAGARAGGGFELPEELGDPTGQEQRADQMAGAQAVYRGGVCWVSGGTEAAEGRKMEGLLCWAIDWRIVGVGREEGGCAPPTICAVLKLSLAGSAEPGRDAPQLARVAWEPASLRLATLASAKRAPRRHPPHTSLTTTNHLPRLMAGAGQTRRENGLDWSCGEGESLSGPVVVFPEVLEPAAQQCAAHGQQVRSAFTTPEHTRLLEALPNHCLAASLHHARADEIAGRLETSDRASWSGCVQSKRFASWPIYGSGLWSAGRL